MISQNFEVPKEFSPDKQSKDQLKNSLKKIFWKSILRNMLVNGLVEKKIEEYGIIKLLDKGRYFLENPESHFMSVDKNFDNEVSSNHILTKKQNPLDKVLYDILIQERLKLSGEFGIPPFAIFQESSIEEMTFKYPINFSELSSISGVGEGKSKKFGDRFISIISKYCDDNNIEREEDLIIKSTGSKSGLKLFIIQSIDKKLSIDEISQSKKLTYKEVLSEISTIVYSGTKLDLTYLINDIFDDESQDEIYDFLIDSKEDDLSLLNEEFGEEFDEDDLKLYSIHFYCKVAF